jgi:hypothetical protein
MKVKEAVICSLDDHERGELLVSIAESDGNSAGSCHMPNADRIRRMK